MSLESDSLHVETQDDGVGRITLDRPDQLNTINEEMLVGLSDAIDRLERDNSTRAVLLIGADETFSAGADVNRDDDDGPDRITAGQRSRTAQRTFEKFRESPLPVVAGIDGYCLGGGMELTMCADVRIASGRATFGLPERNLGVLPSWGGTQRLPRIIGEGRAIEMILTGDHYDAETMERFGYLTDTVPAEDLHSHTREFAADLAAGPPLAQACIKETVYAAYSGTKSGFDLESRSLERLVSTDDFQEGIQAFQENRDPQFRGE